MDSGYNFFAFLSRMKHINRWGLMRNTRTENLEEHSFEVAVIAHALAVIKNTYFNGKVNSEKIALFAMYHDCNETITGDMPTPIKYYNHQIRDAYKKIEDISKDKLISMLPEEMKEYYKEVLFFEDIEEYKYIVKAADKISAYIKCIEEEKVGNSEFKKARESILKNIEQINKPEVKFFMDKFIPGYLLSLDEQE